MDQISSCSIGSALQVVWVEYCCYSSFAAKAVGKIHFDADFFD